jgi:hypothetical protein
MMHMFPDVSSTGVSEKQLKSDMVNAVPLNPQTDLPVNHRFLIGNSVTPEAFLTQISETQDAVAFVGHSTSVLFDPTGKDNFQKYAVGLIMGSTVGTDNEAIVIASNPNPPAGLDLLKPGNIDAVYASQDPRFRKRPSKLDSHAKIIFIGACNLADVFKYWWNINESTHGQSLVVPAPGNDDVPLGIARFEWTLIAQGLAQGKSISDAVAAANSTIHVATLFDQPVPTTLSWIVIGDNKLKLRTKSQ